MQNRDSFTEQVASADHIVSFFRKLRLDWLLLQFPPRLVRSVYGFVTIGVLAVLAPVSWNPFVFPSLVPTAYLLFFTPLGSTSSPRNTVLGHAIGLVCGYAAFGVTHAVHCHSESIREFSGQGCWQRFFHSRRQVRSWYFSRLAIRWPARRR